MTRKDIVEAYAKYREIDHTVPDEVLDFMYRAALRTFEAMQVLKTQAEQDSANFENGIKEVKEWVAKGEQTILFTPVSTGISDSIVKRLQSEGIISVAETAFPGTSFLRVFRTQEAFQSYYNKTT